jgi:SAM-dependent methyltransferase
MGAYGTRDPQADIEIEVVNVEQAAAWDGHEGDVWTEQADRYDRASRRVWERFPVAELVGREHVVLDVGCGTGTSTRDAARRASGGGVTGLDLSTRMLDLARTRSATEGLDNVAFVRGDAQVYPFEPQSFDVAMSSFGTMFFSDPVAAFTNIGRAVRPGGTLAFMSWRELAANDWLMSLRAALALGRELPTPPPDAPTPFAHAEPDRVRAILDPAGFDDISFEPVDEPIDLGPDPSEALAFVKTTGIVEGLTADLDEPSRELAMANLAALMSERATDDGVLLPSAAWLVIARRR